MNKHNFLSLLSFFLFFCIIQEHSIAQDNSNESLIQNPADTNEFKRLVEIAGNYRFSKPDSSINYSIAALSLARQLNFDKGEALALITLGEDHRLGGDFPQALESLFEALRISRNIRDQALEANSLDFIGIAYVALGESRLGLKYLLDAKKLNEKLSLTIMHSFGMCNIGTAYDQLNMYDSALFYEEKAFQLQTQLNRELRSSPLKSLILRQLGNIQYHLGNYDKALNYYHEVIGYKDLLNISNCQYHVAEYFFNIKNNPDSSLQYALLAFNNSQKSLQKTWGLDASILLARLYKAKNKLDSAYYYHEIAMKMKDSLFGPEKFHRLQLLAINEQQRQQEIQKDKENYQNKIRLYILLGIVGVFLLLAIIFYRNNRQKQKANILLERQKKEIQDTLVELKSTQSQLIQSEKMASLGELTAGIAHEIQNPLNFVNNFSDVNQELLLEMKAELDKNNPDDAKTIADSVIENEEKINHHGKRADAIVKGMLQHSRKGTGLKEPRDINSLANEYLSLAYHGFRARDNSFNATLKTSFDENIGLIPVISQDIGRVLLNLYNNAFYAILEKKKQHPEGFEPIVTVSTKRSGDKVEIGIKDNGNGILQTVKDKIFQPFFTTKPTGEGTGLGLSMAYDIIKAHGGVLKVESKEGEGAEFIIHFPLV